MAKYQKPTPPVRKVLPTASPDQFERNQKLNRMQKRLLAQWVQERQYQRLKDRDGYQDITTLADDLRVIAGEMESLAKSV